MGATSWFEFQDNFLIDVVMCGAFLGFRSWQPKKRAEQYNVWTTSWSEFQDNFVIDVVMCDAFLANSSEHYDAGSCVYSQ
jgi:hypothetical protein